MAQKQHKGPLPEKVYLVQSEDFCKVFYSDTYAQKLFEKIIMSGGSASIWEYIAGQCIARGGE